MGIMETNLETLEVYKRVTSDMDFIGRRDANDLAQSDFFTNEVETKEFKVLDKYKNQLNVKVIGRRSKNDIQLYVIEHKNPNAKHFKIEYRMYTTKEIAKLNLKRL